MRTSRPQPPTIGLVLAAGAGRRMGRPKALVRDADALPWVVRTVRTLRSGGCAQVAVVVGAAAAEVVGLLADENVSPVAAPDWETGMAGSLRSGLTWAVGTNASAVLVHLVDLPDVGTPVIRRVLASADGNASLARASYGGRPGHPVLLGRDHWPGALAAAHADRGAAAYVNSAGCVLVECADLASGNDQDSCDA